MRRTANSEASRATERQKSKVCPPRCTQRSPARPSAVRHPHKEDNIPFTVIPVRRNSWGPQDKHISECALPPWPCCAGCLPRAPRRLRLCCRSPPALRVFCADRTLDVARAAAAAPRGLFSRVRVVIPAFSCMAALLAALLAATAGCCCWLLLLAAGCWLLAAGCWLLWLAVLVLAGGRAATDKAV